MRNFTSKAWGSARRGNTSKNVIPSLGKPDWGSSEYGEESGRVRLEGIKKVGRSRRVAYRGRHRVWIGGRRYLT